MWVRVGAVGHALSMRRVGRVCALVLMTAGLVVLSASPPMATPAAAAPIVGFAARFATNDNGTISIFGNNLLTCPTSDSRCAGARAGTARLNNNSFAMVNVDVDGVAGTFNSSSAVVAGPADGQVVWAGLYWGARVSAGAGGSAGPGGVAARRVMSFRPAGASTYQSVSSQATFGPTSGDLAYQEFADVTDLVRNAGSGTYWGANVVAGTGEDRYAGWSLVVVYRAPDLPLRNLTVFDGFADVGQGNPQQITISGFLAPAAPAPVETQLGLVGYEGDFATSGDQAQLNGTLLSTTPLTPSNNFFNGTNDDNGRSVTNRSPADVNMLGFDIKNLGASGINNGDTTATINLNSTGDRYFPGVVTTAIKLFAPDFSTSTKTVNNLAGRTPALPGDQLEYTLTYPNTGQDAATDVNLVDTLPPGTTFLGATPSSGTCAPAGGTINCTVGTIAVGAVWQATVRVLVGAAASNTTLTNAALLNYTAQTLGSPFTYRVAPASIPVGAVADLSLAKTTGPDPGIAGGRVTSTLTVTNSGPSPATGVVVTDQLPDGVTFVSASPGCAAAAGTVTCTVGTLAPGATAAVTVTVAIPPGSTAQSLVNVASVSSDTADLNPENNSAASTVAVTRQADLIVTKTADPSTVVPGQTTTYTVTVHNNGPSDAVNVSATDSVSDPDLALTSATAPGATCTATGDAAQCTIPVLASGDSLTMRVVGRVSPDAPGSLAIANTATATSNTSDPDDTNNTATSSVTTAAPLADIATTKTSGIAVAGGQVTYTVTVTNKGPSAAGDVSLADVLPAGLDPINAVSSRGTCATGATISCNLGTLPGPDPGGQTSTATVTITAKIPPDFPVGNVTNTVTTSTPTADPTPGNDDATVTTAVTAAADVSVTKTADPVQPAAGEDVTFTVTVTNSGPSTARDVVLADALPAGFTLVSVDPGTCTGTTQLSCSTGDLEPGATTTVTVVMHIPSGFDLDAGAVNRASVTSTTPDPAAGNNEATVTVTTRQIADLQAVKWDTTDAPPPPGTPPRSFNAGETVTYNVAAVNLGTSDAAGVRIIDTLPPGVTFVSTDPPDFCPFVAPNQVICDIPGSFPPNVGIFVPITVRIDADLADGTLLTNSAEVTFTDPNRIDPVSSNNFAALTNPITTAADLEVSKRTYSLDLPSGDLTIPSAAPAGTPTGYLIDVRNDGPSIARDVVLADSSTMKDFFLNQVRVIRPGLDPEAIDITADCSSSGGDLQCPLGDLPVFAAADPSWTIQVDGVTLSNAAAGSYQNTATVTSSTPETNPDDNSSTAPITVTAPVATLTLDKTSVGSTDIDGDGDPDFVPGATFAYQLEVANVLDLTREGAADADGVVVTDTLPAGFTATAVAPSQGTCDITPPATVTCDLGTVLGPGRVPEPPPVLITVSGTISPAARGTATNTATVTSPVSAPVTATHAQDLVPVADIAITKIPDATEVAAGAPAGFSLVVTNAGPSDAVDTEAGDLFPAGITFSPELSDPRCAMVDSPAGSFVSCAIGTLAAGDSRTVRVSGQVDPGQPPGEVVNVAAASSPITGEYDFSNNRADVPITIVQAADLVVSKVADADTVTVGNHVTYTVTVTNAGPSNASTVEVTDQIPAGLRFVSAPSDCSVAASTVTCVAPALAAGAAATYPIVLDLPAGLDPGAITNTAAATSQTPDPDPSNNSATATVSALVVADTAITKTVLTKNPVAGQPVQFALDIVNNGPQDASRVLLSDSLAPGLTLVSARVSGGAACQLTRPEDVDVVSCEVGTVPVGGTARAIVTVDTDATLTSIANGASVGSAALDEISADNFDLIDVALQPPPTPTTTTTSTPPTTTTPTTPGTTTTAPTTPTTPSPISTTPTTTSTTPTVTATPPSTSGPPTPGGGGSLPVTGVAIGGITAIGVCLVLVGRALQRAGRRRATRSR
jgi:uncharacterized repeat protein (TIGR01451 family)